MLIQPNGVKCAQWVLLTVKRKSELRSTGEECVDESVTPKSHDSDFTIKLGFQREFFFCSKIKEMLWKQRKEN